MKTITVAEFIDFLKNSSISRKETIDEHHFEKCIEFHDVHFDEMYTNRWSGYIGWGVASVFYEYPDQQYISYYENFKYPVDDRYPDDLVCGELDDMDLYLEHDDIASRVFARLNFDVIAVDEHGIEDILDDEEIREIVDNTLDLAVDYSVLKRYSLEEEGVDEY